jgi:SAM-dependent methyltransferase
MEGKKTRSAMRRPGGTPGIRAGQQWHHSLATGLRKVQKKARELPNMNLARKIFPGLYKTANRLEAENLELREQRDGARIQRDRARERNELLGERLRRVENSRYELWSERYGGVYNLNLPPEELQNHIGSIGRGFFLGGFDIAQEAGKLLEDHAGRPLDSFQSILDFGCGSGRVTRFFKPAARAARLFGCDIDRPAIEWCSKNLSDVGQFTVNPFEPPAPYSDRCFDFIFVFSVFTHLPEAMQFAWLADLKRMLQPGGVLLATFHGTAYRSGVPATQEDEFRKHGFIYTDKGKTDGLPDFYLTTHHSHEYIRERWSEFFEVSEIVPQGIQTHDVAICRARG